MKGFRAKIDAISARLILQIYTVLKINNFHPISLRKIENSNRAKSESSSFESNSGLQLIFQLQIKEGFDIKIPLS